MITETVFELDTRDGKVGFHFGMLASAHTEEISGTSIYEVFQGIAKSRVKSILHYFYGGAIAYNEYNGIDKKVTMGDVAKVIDQVGTVEALKIYTASIKMHVPKNGVAPKEEAGLRAE